MPRANSHRRHESFGNLPMLAMHHARQTGVMMGELVLANCRRERGIAWVNAWADGIPSPAACGRLHLIMPGTWVWATLPSLFIIMYGPWVQAMRAQTTQVDPCTLLTTDDLQSVIGETFNPPPEAPNYGLPA